MLLKQFMRALAIVTSICFEEYVVETEALTKIESFAGEMFRSSQFLFLFLLSFIMLRNFPATAETTSFTLLHRGKRNSIIKFFACCLLTPQLAHLLSATNFFQYLGTE